MTRIFIRDEYHCGQQEISAEDYVNQFDAPRLFGRALEIGLLNHAWTDSQSRLFLLHGATGMGKTALIHKWLHNLQKKHWHDAEAVFLWSFYPPDLAHVPQDPVEEFFRHALFWFGGEAALQCPNLLQGEYLAKLVQAHHTLLILDGLEVLQFKSGSTANQLGDPRLNVLLERLAAQNTGLCVTVSREPLLGHFSGTGIQHHELEKLSVDAAAECLSHKGVQADTDRLRQMAVDYGQNPLTLNLLGGYLNVWHNGDWQQMEKIPVLMDQQTDGRHARRILVANATELAGMPGEAILYLLSMLYRPIHWDALENLLGKERSWLPAWFPKKPQDHYASLIGGFLRLNQRKRYLAILQLRELGLLELSGRCFWLPQWVRDGYQRQLRFDWPVAWKETNQQLMQFHATLPKTAADLSGIIPLTDTRQSVKVAAPFSRLVAPAITEIDVQPEEIAAPAIAEAQPEASTASIIEPVIAEAQPEETVTPAVIAALPEPEATPPLDLDWLNALTPTVSALTKTVDALPVAAAPAETMTATPETPVVATSAIVTLPAAAPTLTRADLNNLIDLSAKLKQYQNSLQMLEIRTKKYQKHVRQLDKEVQSMHYPPARTGTASR